MPGTVKEAMFRWLIKRWKRRCRTWDVALMALEWTMGRNMIAFDGIEKIFTH